MRTQTATPQRVQVGWRIDVDLKRWIDIEAAKRQLVPARVIEELIAAMQETTTDAKS